MRILIAEDDLTSRLFMEKYLGKYGKCDVATNGMEAIDLFVNGMESNESYDLVCLDIMMPKVDGIKALKAIRDVEKTIKKDHYKRAKIIMTTAINDRATVEEAYRLGCDAYAWKPIDVDKFSEVLEKLELI